MDSQKIKAIVIAVIVGIVALWLGLNAATAQLETVLWVTGGSTLLVCAILGKRIWMIIPFASALNLTLMIPGQPSMLLLAQALFCAFCTILFLSRKLPVYLKITELDIWVFILVLCVVQAYLRNPVGLNIFGSGSVGGKPYAIFAITLFSSIILSRLRISPIDLKWLLRLHIIGGLINFVLLAFGHLIPKIGLWYGSVNLKAIDGGIDQDGPYGINSATRIIFVRDIARNLALWVSAFKSPLKACFHPLWAPLILLSLTFAALSGFRSEIAAVGFTYLVAIAYRGGVHSVIISIGALAICLGILAIVNIATPLPSNIQRSLSFFPGTWDEYYKKDGQSSTDWRVEMWKEALLTDFWIKNKILGDGLGIRRDEADYMTSFRSNFLEAQGKTRSNTLSLQQELMMVSNNYHSGPVSTIRAVGYIGLAILLIAQIRLAGHAHRQIKRARDSEWFPLTLLVGIPIIWAPAFFVLIIGDFGNAISAYLLGAAFIGILENNLPLPPYSKRGTGALITGSTAST